MIIREANHKDISQILKVLKASLGETSSKKTEEIWKYKHIDNPFGESLVLIAEENEEIIGVRAFMRWKWQKGDEVFYAFRAVDTATHPSHQGKGIFKKLTLKAIEVGEELGVHFIFNTPNAQSKPGYLKMGWKEISKIRVALYPTLNFSKKSFDYKHDLKSNLNKTFLDNYKLQQKESNKIFTPKTKEYLDWRYVNCKLQKYFIFEDEELFLAGYIKKRGRVNELRISEAIYANQEQLDVLRKVIKHWKKITGAFLISVAPRTFFSYSWNLGPMLTLRNLNLNQVKELEFSSLKEWSYSLGDLELF